MSGSVESTPWSLAWSRHRDRVVAAALASMTLGLAPFYPHAHIWKQLTSLARGTLRAPIDVFDLAMHGAPWVALVVTLTHLGLSASRLSAAQRRSS
ncbi:MAG: RND transporter [Deltaproteobacteria bacterium]|nr:hypothetical protein [Myxococcales bacterium]MDP3218113.1 RND transporter [Deltaproteobacteria bacterium]